LTSVARDWLLSEAEAIVVSPLLHYELSHKQNVGKLELAIPAREFVPLGMQQLKAAELPLAFKHSDLSDSIPWHRKDPFDRLLALQALAERIPVIASDSMFERYGLRRIW
jgi:PIN domain nuclease of toxin-antitoxin system